MHDDEVPEVVRRRGAERRARQAAEAAARREAMKARDRIADRRSARRIRVTRGCAVTALAVVGAAVTWKGWT